MALMISRVDPAKGASVTEEEKAGQGISRRTLLKRVGAAGAIAWTTPVIASLRTPAFAASPGPNPECVGASCSTFIQCSSGNPDCICVTTDQGGLCVPGSTACGGLVVCPNGTADCPTGELCAVNTCCGGPVCVPLELACVLDGGAAPLRTSSAQPTPTGANTLAGW